MSRSARTGTAGHRRRRPDGAAVGRRHRPTLGAAAHRPRRPGAQGGVQSGGRSLATAGGDRAVWLWDVDARRPSGTFSTGHRRAYRVSRSARTGRPLATASGDGSVGCGMSTPPSPRWARSSDTQPGRSLAFSPDGHRLATASEDGRCGFGTSPPPKPSVRPPRPHHAVSTLAFSPDGHRLATASEDGSVRLWDVDTAQAALGAADRTRRRGPRRGVQPGRAPAGHRK